ncbi:MAG: hypothetical protein ACOCV4_04645 [Myxococcota bacterium]
MAAPALAVGQPFSEDVLQPDAFEDDPLGTGATDDLHRVPVPGEREKNDRAADPHAAPPAPDVEVREGEVVQAVPAVRETAHRVRLTLADGLVRADVVMRFVNAGSYPAEVGYRLAVPEGAELADFAVCRDERCRRGSAVGPSEHGRPAYDAAVRARGPEETGRPVGHGRRVRHASGLAMRIHAAPVPTDGELEVRLAWVAPAPVRGGTARVTLPARGTDPRTVPADVTVRAEDLLSPTVAGAAAERSPVTIEPWMEAEVLALQATAASPRATVHRFPCGEQGRCARTRVTAGPRPGDPKELLVLWDVSPSTQGPARGRLTPALASVLAMAPEGSRVRALAFGSEARIVQKEPRDVQRTSLSPFGEAAEWDLGAATRFEAVWPHVRAWVHDTRRAGREPLVLLLGDGGMTRSEAGGAAFAEAARRGVAVHALNVGDRSPRSALAEGVERTGGLLLSARDEAEAARKGRSAGALEDRLAALFAPVLLPRVTVRAGRDRVDLGPLRAGEELVLEAPTGRGPVQLRAPGLRVVSPALDTALHAPLAARIARRGDGTVRDRWVAVDRADLREVPDVTCGKHAPAQRPSGVSSDAAPVALAEPRACETDRKPPPDRLAPPEDPLAGKGLPARTMLGMLRRRVLPVARRCFREDRRGRTDYAVRAELVFRLAEREVVDARVQGELSERLRTCLLEAVDTLDVPRFEGTVAVRYPVYTEAAPEPPRIELESPVADEIREVTEGQPTTPPPP